MSRVTSGFVSMCRQSSRPKPHAGTVRSLTSALAAIRSVDWRRERRIFSPRPWRSGWALCVPIAACGALPIVAGTARCDELPRSQSIWSSAPRTVTRPRRSGHALVRAMKAAPRPGILAKTPWGPRVICPVVTSYLDWCQGQTKQPSASMLPSARSARRCRHRLLTAKYSPLLPTA